jgi:hypothetical protein
LLHLSLTSLVGVLQKFSKLSFDLSESFYNDLDVEVVHDIRVVSFERNTVRSNNNGLDSIYLLGFIVFFVNFLSFEIKKIDGI